MTLGPLMIDIAGTELTAEDRDILAHPLVGGVIMFARNFAAPEQMRALTASIRSLRSPELLIAVDQEGGRVQRFADGFTRLPALRGIGRVFDNDEALGRRLARLHGTLMATEVLSVGVDFSFAPVVDIDRGLCEVIGDRSPHCAPDGVATLSLAYMQGMRRAGMAAVAKHFPGHGGVVGDSHHVLPEDRREFADLLDDLRPYETLIDDGLRGVMMAHIRYPAICDEVASLSSYWIREVLRRQLGFRGAVFSDDLSMAGAGVAGGPVERARAAVTAGADMILICTDRPAAEQVIAAIPVQPDAAVHARLAAMRPVGDRYAAAPFGSSAWQACRDELLAAFETPPLQLDGDS